MKAKRTKPRRTVHPIQLRDASVNGSTSDCGSDRAGSNPARPSISLRQLARGRPCMVALPGCLRDTETTVLAHYRMLPYCGAGMKPPDWMASWACARCHDAIDGRDKHGELAGYTKSMIRSYHAQGVLATLAKLIEEGHVRVPG